MDKKIKKDLITQMHFYAGLYFYCKNTWPTKLTLITKTGEYQKIDYTYEHSVQLITSAQCMMFTINTVINNSSISETKKQELLARPSPKTCYFCEYRPDCIEYINQRISNEHQNWPIDKFLLIEKIDPQKNNKVIITGTELASNKKVRVLGSALKKLKRV